MKRCIDPSDPDATAKWTKKTTAALINWPFLMERRNLTNDSHVLIIIGVKILASYVWSYTNRSLE